MRVRETVVAAKCFSRPWKLSVCATCCHATLPCRSLSQRQSRQRLGSVLWWVCLGLTPQTKIIRACACPACPAYPSRLRNRCFCSLAPTPAISHLLLTREAEGKHASLSRLFEELVHWEQPQSTRFHSSNTAVPGGCRHAVPPCPLWTWRAQNVQRAQATSAAR